MKEPGRLLKRPWILAVGVVVLMTGHVIFFDHLRHAGVSAVAIAGLALLAIAKHLGMLGPLYSRFRRRSRNQQSTVVRSRTQETRKGNSAMKPRLRKFALTCHVTFSVGWLGAVAAFLALSIVGLTGLDPVQVRGAYLSMNLLGLYVIVPMSLAALATGLVQALGTEWGLLRYYWVLTKFLLTLFGSVLLLLHQFTAVERAASLMSGAVAGTLPNAGRVGIQLVADASLAILLLLVATTLSVFKPWGPTRSWLRKQPLGQRNPSAQRDNETPFGFKIVLAVIGLFVVVILLSHLTGHGLGHHTH